MNELTGGTFDTDKSEEYLARYAAAFAHLTGSPIRLLELGVLKGGSLELWASCFPHGVIAGLDLNPIVVHHPRIKMYQGSQDDGALLDRIVAEVAPDGFDIIIDDASHLGGLTKASFDLLYDRHLKAGGIYVIEDWGTGYWGTWPDGQDPRPAHRGRPRQQVLVGSKVARRFGRPTVASRLEALSGTRDHPSHAAGMVGVVKQLIDETSKATDPRLGASAPPRIAEMRISDGQVFCFKPAI